MVAVERCVHFTQKFFAVFIFHAADDAVGLHEVLDGGAFGQEFGV